MKKQLVKAVHRFFQFPPAERILLGFAEDKFIGSLTSKFIPPNTLYPNPTKRIAKRLGFKVNVNLNDYNDWKAYWGLREIEREHLYRLAEGAKTVVDVGVNNGWVMMNLAKILEKSGGHVYGFEPHPDTFKRSLSNISSNKISNATLYNLGCGDAAAEFKMITTVASNSGQNRIVQEDAGAASHHLATVKVVRLDDHLEQVGNIDLIKIDVEGFEQKVIEGAAGILTRYKPVLFIELDDKLLKANGSSAAELVNFISKFDYQIKEATHGKQVTVNSALDGCHYDIICK